MFVYVPNGMDMRTGTPTTKGSSLELPQTLKPLEPLKDDILAARQPDAQHRARLAGRRRAITGVAAARI